MKIQMQLDNMNVAEALMKQGDKVKSLNHLLQAIEVGKEKFINPNKLIISFCLNPIYNLRVMSLIQRYASIGLGDNVAKVGYQRGLLHLHSRSGP